MSSGRGRGRSMSIDRRRCGPAAGVITSTRSARNTASGMLMGDEQHGLARLPSRCAAARGSSARASWRRARRRARPSAAATGRAPARGRSPTRCCMPPESCYGYLSSKPVEADHLEQRARARPRVGAHRHAAHLDLAAACSRSTVRQGSSTRRLEHDADVGAAGRRPRGPPMLDARRRWPAAGRPTSFSSVLLPQPLGPTTDDELAGRRCEVQRLQRSRPSPSRVR